MKILFKDLYNISDERKYDVQINEINIKDNTFINGIKNVDGFISFYYDIQDRLFIKYELKGLMLCPDSVSLQNVEVPFDLNEDCLVTTKQNEEGFYFIDGMSIEDFVAYIVIPEAPIKVEKTQETMYYSGDGWTISSEEAYNNASKDKIDPRLEKLLEYKEEN